MMRETEARLRIAVHSMGVTKRNGEFRVFFPELTGREQEASAYYTDDAEDAALTAGKMRDGQQKAQAQRMRQQQGKELA